MIDLTKAFEVDANGLLIENGAAIISGSASPESISVSMPTFYLRTNGETYFNAGNGSWALVGPQGQIDAGNANSVYGGANIIDNQPETVLDWVDG